MLLLSDSFTRDALLTRYLMVGIGAALGLWVSFLVLKHAVAAGVQLALSRDREARRTLTGA